MTSPERHLKPALNLKENWPEGQQMPEQAGYSPHPLATEAAHAEADLPNARPVGYSVAERNSENDEPEKPVAVDIKKETKTAQLAKRNRQGIALLSPSLGRVDADKVEFVTARSVVDGLFSGWRNAPDRRVVATRSNLPAVVLKELANQGEKTARGVFHGNTFYLVADEHASEAEVEYYRNEKSLEQSTTPSLDISLRDVVQSAQDSGKRVFTEADVVNLYGLRYSHKSPLAVQLHGEPENHANFNKRPFGDGFTEVRSERCAAKFAQKMILHRCL